MRTDSLSYLENELQRTQVLVFAGGMGKRMGVPQPKALVEVGGERLIDRCINYFANSGYSRFVFLLSYGHEDIVSHVGDGKDYGVKVTYSIDPKVGLGRGRSLRHSLESKKVDLSMRSIITFPDDIFTDDLLPQRILLEHLYAVKGLGSLASLVLTRGRNWPYGVAEVDESGVISEFVEKPFISKPTSVGLYIFEPPVYDTVMEEIRMSGRGQFELEKTVIPSLASSRRLYGIFIPSQCWLPINTQKDLEEAEKAISGMGSPPSKKP